MIKRISTVKKWMVRLLVASGALVGVSACSYPCVYGPPPSYSESESSKDEASKSSDSADECSDAAIIDDENK